MCSVSLRNQSPELDGHLLLTTPRGELWRQYFKHAQEQGIPLQPVGAWMTEKEVTHLLAQSHFVRVAQDRALPVSYGSYLLWRVYRSLKARGIFPEMAALLSYHLSIYQIWWATVASNHA